MMLSTTARTPGVSSVASGFFLLKGAATLAVSREKDGKLRLVCAGSKVVQPDEVLDRVAKFSQTDGAVLHHHHVRI